MDTNKLNFTGKYSVINGTEIADVNAREAILDLNTSLENIREELQHVDGVQNVELSIVKTEDNKDAIRIVIDDNVAEVQLPETSLTRPTTQPDTQVIPSITTTNEQQNLTIGDGLEIKDGALTTRKYVEANPADTGTEDLTKLKVGKTIYNIPSGSSGGGVNILELNNADATAVGNAINKLYKSADDTTEIPLTTPVDFSKTYQYISYIWDGIEVIQTIGRYMRMGDTKLYMSMDKLSYFSTFEADNKSLGLTLGVVEENGVSTGKIYVARTATM